MIQKLLILVFTGSAFINFAAAQEADKIVRIDTTEARKVLQILAHDSLGGRQPFTPGIRKSAEFIRNRMADYGLKPFYPYYNDSVTRQEVNIVGLLEGKVYPEQYVLISAHYDHLGIVGSNGDSIANGANDNASGVAAMLSLAKYFAEQPEKPDCSLLFAAFTLEESGLYGSRNLASRFLKEQRMVKAVINFDMLGTAIEGYPGQVYATGFKKSNLPELLNRQYGEDIIVHLPYSEQYGFFRLSDNYPFFQLLDVPAHTFTTFTLTNYSFYHDAEDEINRLDMANFFQILLDMPALIKIASNKNTTFNINQE